MSKLALLNEENLFELNFKENNKKGQLPISLFQEIEAKLCDHFLHGGLEDDETDGAAEFIKNIVDTVMTEIVNLIENVDQKNFLNILTKIFTISLSVKADNSEKIIKIVKLAISAVLKTWSELN